MMKVIKLQEQFLNNTDLPLADSEAIIPYMDDKSEVVFNIQKDREEMNFVLA